MAARLTGAPLANRSFEVHVLVPNMTWVQSGVPRMKLVLDPSTNKGTHCRFGMAGIVAAIPAPVEFRQEGNEGLLELDVPKAVVVSHLQFYDHMAVLVHLPQALRPVAAPVCEVLHAKDDVDVRAQVLRPIARQVLVVVVVP